MSNEINIALMDEGLNVWRPVPALRLQGDTYVVLRPDDYDPTVESWQFPPGTLVICEQKQLSDGIVPVAMRQTQDARRTA
jgi:hypothetical protein